MFCKKLATILRNADSNLTRLNNFKCLRTTVNKSQNELENHLISKIRIKGPITVADFMKEALGNPLWVKKKSCEIFDIFIN
jgi:hypothetical protein